MHMTMNDSRPSENASTAEFRLIALTPLPRQAPIALLNHVDLILTPATPDGLSRAPLQGGAAFCRLCRRARARETGRLFEAGSAPVAKDETHC